ncbi:stabilin-2-like isoform X2 [Mercenaria mercenaria]|uniref:stabilin-2-like isoform X2 n=1 Tax=Mercenaria mercenaria TaxID=6596 RepID=UPI00234F7B2E|nr:stabilin-2-like isoform X2 [Mercenaria mercenaria]
MDLSFWRKIVVLAAVFQVSAAYSSTTIPPPCPKYPPRACISNSGCSQVKGQVCVGEEGSRFCRKCLCNKHSECNVQGNSLTCSCSEGYTGEYCECPPVQPVTGCTDPYVVNTNNCTEFSNSAEDFLTIENVDMTHVEFQQNSFQEYENESACREICISNPCQFYKWEETSHTCSMVTPTKTLKEMLSKVEIQPNIRLGIRKCNHC